MDSIRQNKVAKQIQRDLSDIFQSEYKSLIPGALITITVVRVSPDLGLAKVYLSIFPSENSQAMIEKISENTNSIRHSLTRKMRHQQKKMPEIVFYLDDSLDYIDKIDDLLK